MSNLLTNGDFAGGTCRATLRIRRDGTRDRPVLGEVEVPEGWVFWWRDGFPGPGVPAQLTGQPEAKVLRLPSFPDRRRIRSGNAALLAFTFWRNHDCGLYQRVTVQPGRRYRFSIYWHSWHSECDAKPHDGPLAKDCRTPLGDSHDWVSVGIDPLGGDDPAASSIVWSAEREQYGDYGEPIAVEATAQADTITVWVRARTMYALKHCDTYYDDAELVEVPWRPEPEPERPRGAPRWDYARTYNVIPQDATLERATAIFRGCWLRSRETVGGSHDDAGVGDLSTRVAVLWDIPQSQRQTYLDWYAHHYPGVEVRFEGLGAGDGVPPPDSILLSQRDPRWAARRFGSPSCTSTIGQAGCFVVCLAMAQRYLGIRADATPVTVDEALGPSGYTGCRALWAAIGARLGMTIRSGTEQDVRRVLAEGGCALAEVSPATYEHFVLVVRYEAGRYWAYDPWRGLADWLDSQYPGVDSWRVLTRNTVQPEPPARYNPRSLSLHLQTMAAGVLEFVAAARPSCIKRVMGGQDLIALHGRNPGMVCVYRPYEEDGDPTRYVQKHLATIRQLCDALPEVYIESVNEVYGSNRSDNARWRDWELRFVAALKAAEPRARPVTFCAAVGNPPEDQYDLLVPLARATTDAGGLLGYHGYWAATPTWCSLDDYQAHGRWLQYRWQMIDEYLTAHGVYPRWFLGETGAVGGRPVAGGGYHLLPVDGWRSPECLRGDWARYLRQCMQFAANLAAWNATHGGRCVGGVLFTTGQGTGWETFQIAAREMADLGASLTRQWPIT